MSRRELRMEELLEIIRTPNSNIQPAVEEWLFLNKLNDDQFEHIYPGNVRYEIEWSRSDDKNSLILHRECHGLDYRTMVARMVNVLRFAESLTIYRISECSHAKSEE